ncbi:hypothetical protein B0H65DRAFT_430404 [Neurospora tetraspora]|uniref:UBA domain-containing protein n=1 Tax=Neurospora tetraspora TaxID=94610 RepID=A0AAE0JBV9_9PEZI|nr:hypothetical protein B0H65DRAFT_430404 [Neurospora tetraspora]
MLVPLDAENNKATMAQQPLDACCTCATLLSSVPRFVLETEKPLPDDRRLSCCGRVICGNCIYNNPRFSSYCPYCQTPSSSSSSSSSYPTPINPHAIPPTTAETQDPKPSKDQKVPDTIHHLHPHDTLPSLSLRYSVPLPILLAHNRLPLFSLSTSSSPFHSSSSALLFARGRRTILIPGEYNPSGVSLSPFPVESEEEIEKKKKIRKWMMRTKVADYDVAVLYLEGCGFDVEQAVKALRDDERWEREHPLRDGDQGRGTTKGKGRVMGRTWISGVKRLVPPASTVGK